MKFKLGDKIVLKRRHEKGEIESHPYGEKKKGYL